MHSLDIIKEASLCTVKELMEGSQLIKALRISDCETFCPKYDIYNHLPKHGDYYGRGNKEWKTQRWEVGLLNLIFWKRHGH